MPSTSFTRSSTMTSKMKIRKGSQVFNFFNFRVYGMFLFGSPSFVVKDIDVIKQITIKDFDSFINHDKSFDESVDKIAGKGLFSMFDEKWRAMRNSLSPIFTSSKMKMMFETVNECAQDFVAHYEKKAAKDKVIIDAKDVFARFTVDGISTAALGFKGDCVENEDSALFKMAISINSTSFVTNAKVFLLNLAKPLYVFLGLQFLSQEVRDFFHRVIVEVMHEREAKGLFRSDIIQLLLQVKNGKLDKDKKPDEKDIKNFAANIEYDVKPKDRKMNWTDEDFMAQGFIFFGAGFDTTKNLLQTLSYELAMNRNVQQELIDEVDEVLSSSEGKSVTYEALHKMKFLDQVISESLRYWPPVGGTNRECNKDYTIDLGNGRNLLIKSGEQVFIPVSSIHRDPKFFANPNTFDPHRFDDDKKSLIIPGSYMPFGAGPRVCIGSRFALMEAKLLIFTILSKFTIEVCDKTPKKLEFISSFGAFEFKEKIFVELRPRK